MHRAGWENGVTVSVCRDDLQPELIPLPNLWSNSDDDSVYSGSLPSFLSLPDLPSELEQFFSEAEGAHEHNLLPTLLAGSEDEWSDSEDEEETSDFAKVLTLFFEALGDDFRVDHPKVMAIAWIPGVFERAMLFAGDTVVKFNPDPVPIEMLRDCVKNYFWSDCSLENPAVVAVLHHPAIAAIVREMNMPLPLSRSPTPVLAEFDHNLTPLLPDVVRDDTPLLSHVDPFSRGMYLNIHNEFQKIDMQRQVSPKFASDLLEEFSPVKLEPYDDLHERNCFSRDIHNRKRRKMSLEDLKGEQECTCISRQSNERNGRRSRFVITKMLSKPAFTKNGIHNHLQFRSPEYKHITVSEMEMPECVGQVIYKERASDNAILMIPLHIVP